MRGKSQKWTTATSKIYLVPDEAQAETDCSIKHISLIYNINKEKKLQWDCGDITVQNNK